MAEDQIFSARANARDAIAAFEAVGSYATARLQFPVIAASDRRRDPEQDHERLYRMLGTLRHLAGNFTGVSFTAVLRAAREEYERQRGRDDHRALARRAAVAELALAACERGTSTLRRYHDSAWPPETLADLQRYAGGHGISLEAAMSRLMVWLLADLRHYANRQGIDFTAAMTAADRAYTEQRLSAEGPFQTGLDPGQRVDTVLTPSPAAPAAELIATCQGIVTSFADAEWLLIRTAARTGYQARHPPAYPCKPDEDDLLTLSRALAAMCGQSAGQIISQLTPRIQARITQIEHGPAAAAELGRDHGHAGIEPYCGLDMDGDTTALMHALGETEPTTDANAPHRLALVTAYAQAYQRASTKGPAAAGSPARIAAQGFPRSPAPPAMPAGPAAPDPAARRARARPGRRPRPGSA
jgi:hypothetical protein